MERKKIDSKFMLFALVLILIILLLLNWLLGNNTNNGVWDYEKINSASELIYLGEKIEDRSTYYTLEGIVANYLNSFLVGESENQEGTLNYTQYYEYLTEAYRKHLNQKEYNNVANKFLSKFYVNAKSEYEAMEYMDTNKIIKNIYLFEDNIYLCELRGSQTGNKGYIAFALKENDNIYKLVYIE